MGNNILEAYEQGKRIRRKGWERYWIKKNNETSSIDESGNIQPINKSFKWSFYDKPEQWEIHPEDIATLTETQKAIELLKSQGYEVFKKM
jgi:hypothetical protein